MDRTAGIVAIGNEIQSGKVADTNSPFLAGELRRIGVDLKRIAVIPISSAHAIATTPYAGRSPSSANHARNRKMASLPALPVTAFALRFKRTFRYLLRVDVDCQ